MPAEDEYFGLFQQFRPLGDGVERAFLHVPDADKYISRLLEVFRATSSEECRDDVYFVVRSPASTTPNELRTIGHQFIYNLRTLTAMIGNAELSEYLSALRDVDVVQKSRLNRSNDDNLLVMETVGDWLGTLGAWNDPIPRMREAFYGVACDFFLMYFLQWPYYERWCSLDVFRPYYELWRRGASCSFQGVTLQVAIDSK
jgi:hypothetical protein